MLTHLIFLFEAGLKLKVSGVEVICLVTTRWLVNQVSIYLNPKQPILTVELIMLKL